MNNIRKIIREEIYNIMNEQDPATSAIPPADNSGDSIKMSMDMVKSIQDQISALELELKFRQNDAKVVGLPKEEKKARLAYVESTKKKLDQAKTNLQQAKQSEMNAVRLSQATNNSDQNSVIQTQTTSQI
jgi:hypothetical protein